MGSGLGLLPTLCMAWGASQALGESAEPGPRSGPAFSGHVETISLLHGHCRPSRAMKRVPESRWMSGGQPSEPQRRWGQGPNAWWFQAGRVPWADRASSVTVPSCRHTAGSDNPACREEGRKGHVSTCSQPGPALGLTAM